MMTAQGGNLIVAFYNFLKNYSLVYNVLYLKPPPKDKMVDNANVEGF